MSEPMPKSRIMIILLFVIAFVALGWVAPMAYASYVPSDEIIEVHNYEAQNATVSDESHYICFDRTVSRDMPSDVVTEMYLIGEDGDRIEVDRTRSRELLDEGSFTVMAERDLPDDLRAGTYKYKVVATVDMANGRVTRQISFTSDAFYITDNENMTSNRTEIC